VAEGLHFWGFATARVVAEASTTAATAVASCCGYSSHLGSGFAVADGILT
jgi:hypothetical protein